MVKLVTEIINVPNKLPFLESICWQMKSVHEFTPEEMLGCYERGWKYKKLFNNLEGDEVEFLIKIANIYDSWLKVEL